MRLFWPSQKLIDLHTSQAYEVAQCTTVFGILYNITSLVLQLVKRHVKTDTVSVATPRASKWENMAGILMYMSEIYGN